METNGHIKRATVAKQTFANQIWFVEVVTYKLCNKNHNSEKLLNCRIVSVIVF
jgi:hypothetical protein